MLRFEESVKSSSYLAIEQVATRPQLQWWRTAAEFSLAISFHKPLFIRFLEGVVPEVAARQHVETVNEVVDIALKSAQVKPSQLSGIACTNGPGLIGTLLVGLSAAKALSWTWDVPLNHD